MPQASRRLSFIGSPGAPNDDQTPCYSFSISLDGFGAGQNRTLIILWGRRCSVTNGHLQPRRFSRCLKTEGDQRVWTMTSRAWITNIDCVDHRPQHVRADSGRGPDDNGKMVGRGTAYHVPVSCSVIIRASFTMAGGTTFTSSRAESIGAGKSERIRWAGCSARQWCRAIRNTFVRLIDDT